MDINAMTKALFPVVSVNTDGTMDPMEKPGTRYLIARNGIWLETTRPWLRAVVPHLTESFPVTPFGEIAARILETPPMNPEIMREFISSARKAAPAETGCWVFWNAKTGNQRMVKYEQTCTPDRIDYRRPDPGENEHLVWDIHSHGDDHAFFSEIDDADDYGDVKIAVVIGNVCSRQISIETRLVTREHTLTLMRGHLTEGVKYVANGTPFGFADGSPINNNARRSGW